jgi:transposase
MEHPVLSIGTFSTGQSRVYGWIYGRRVSQNIMNLRVLLGSGNQLMGVWWNHQCEKREKYILDESLLDQTQQTGEKNWVKRNLLVDENGIPLSIVICGANTHDVKMIGDILEAKVMEAPEDINEHLCLDAGYIWDTARMAVIGAGYIPHIRPRWEDVSEKKKDPNWKHPDGKPRRWIVEVAHSWFNNFRKIRIRYEKKSKNYLALLHIVCSIICFRKIWVI